MPFSAAIKQRALERAGGRCECTLSVCSQHPPGVRCNAALRGEWHAHHKVAVVFGGSDDIGNSQVMCLDCFRNAAT
jgi:hypothetical protein